MGSQFPLPFRKKRMRLGICWLIAMRESFASRLPTRTVDENHGYCTQGVFFFKVVVDVHDISNLMSTSLFSKEKLNMKISFALCTECNSFE